MPRKKKDEMPETELTQSQIVGAALNDPEFSEHEVEFGGVKYKLVDLPYEDYVKFLALLQPFLEAMISKVMGGNKSVESVGDLITHCADAIPQMAHLALRQVDPDMTVSRIKEIGKTPFRIAPVVIKQIENNNVIKDISDFFVQILPLMGQVG